MFMPMKRNASNAPSDTDAFETEVADRFGILPNFFRSAQAAPELIQQLWGFAKAGYLDNPMPSVFKERLFVWLSRFCPMRYCIVRHVGFLLGQALTVALRAMLRPLRRPSLTSCVSCGAQLPGNAT